MAVSLLLTITGVTHALVPVAVGDVYGVPYGDDLVVVSRFPCQ